MKMKVMAAFAATRESLDSRIDTMTKQKLSPAEQAISSSRRPNRSISRIGMAEPIRKVICAQPPMMSDISRVMPMFCWKIYEILSVSAATPKLEGTSKGLLTTGM